MPTSRTGDRSSGASRPATADRRERIRLRELCDEVIASYRVARGSDPISDQERADAQGYLSRIAPIARS